MDIIIYAQALETNAPADVYYKDRYVYGSMDEKVDLSQFFKDTYSKTDMIEFEIFDCLKEKKVWAENIDKYLYLYVLSEEIDPDGEHIPIIIQAYREDADKIFDALNEFLERSHRHITEEARKNIKEEIKNFKNDNRTDLYFWALALTLVFAFVFSMIYKFILKH
ncbi:MAG: hypothetical protein II598_02675 [Elusimicrobia bacterium]|nr:hypothetical protein [Elusimicrobiota bacterium]